MVVKELGVDAHATIVTVRKIIPSSNTTKAAVGTMIRRLFGTHPQVANATVILSKLDTALPTLVAVCHREKKEP